jgi:hypothetical protein
VVVAGTAPQEEGRERRMGMTSTGRKPGTSGLGREGVLLLGGLFTLHEGGIALGPMAGQEGGFRVHTLLSNFRALHLYGKGGGGAMLIMLLRK